MDNFQCFEHGFPHLNTPHTCLWTGRGWEASELRLKSFEDLHKLWYVLLAERNRLETIRGYCRTKHIEMPNYGRLGKVFCKCTQCSICRNMMSLRLCIILFRVLLAIFYSRIFYSCQIRQSMARIKFVLGERTRSFNDASAFINSKTIHRKISSHFIHFAFLFSLLIFRILASLFVFCDNESSFAEAEVIARQKKKAHAVRIHL